jgi:hypothetical protein
VYSICVYAEDSALSSDHEDGRGARNANAYEPECFKMEWGSAAAALAGCSLLLLAPAYGLVATNLRYFGLCDSIEPCTAKNAYHFNISQVGREHYLGFKGRRN